MHRRQIYEWDLYPGPTLERYELHQADHRRIPAWMIGLIALLTALILSTVTAVYIAAADAEDEPLDRIQVENFDQLRERAADRADHARLTGR